MKLSLMTWNIHRCIGLDRRFDPDRVIETLRHHKPDILLLQEVDRGVPRSKKIFLDHLIAEAMEYPYHTWSEAHVLKQGSYGNATLSKFPIVKRRVIDLKHGKRKNRNCLYTRLQLPHRSNLHLFNWHLGLSAKERLSQVNHVLSSNTMRDLPKRHAVVLGGDTNDWRNLLYQGSGLGDAGFDAWSEHGRRKPLRTFPSQNPVGALDKFFWRGPLEDENIHVSKLKIARTASDHLPLLAEFRLGKG
ncbi:MAG: endonuclease/exonuclease/phosphatase family protein [Planctomycetota bacterium]|nr:endonuclease/exonuclease/phosphatase family protein [Planctomycetota bacterium]MDA1114612.1 endonuclease/exonuclease/phosphatase family protein [Planctomycetota bacterium]